MKLSFRGWLTSITLVLLVVVVIVAWPEILKAVALTGQVDPWILILLLPVQFLSYYTTGGIMFSYLRGKGDLEDMSHWSTTRLALELNFVNHILPSGGAAGFSYLAWVLKQHGVSVARSTMAQIIRYVLTFIGFVLVLGLAMLILATQHHINFITVFMGFVLVVAAVGSIWFCMWLFGDKGRMQRFSYRLSHGINRFMAWLTRGRKRNAVKHEAMLEFFEGLHDDYVAIRRDRQILKKPLLWAIITNVLDVSLIWIAFWALGFPLNAALLFIAFGLASIVAAVAATPGGAGVYEAIMVAFLAASGVTPDVAIAGTLLARVILLSGTILFGYVFYQLTVIKYGKHPTDR